MEIRLLGPIELRDGDSVVPLRRRQQRALLALLALHAGEVVSTDRLVDALWSRPPAAAVGALQNLVWKLRQLLPAGVLQRQDPGYVLELEPDAVDARRFERLVGEPGSEPAERAARLREALALWRGAPLAGLGDEPFVAEEARRLEELRLAALEDRIDADLELGRHAAVVPELEKVVADHPLRERPVGQIMLALYRCDRQADALQAFRDLRGRLAELGLEPAPDLQELQLGILRQDDSLRAPETHEAQPELGEEPRSRRAVTVVAVDIAGADALDPETLDALLGRALDVTRSTAGRHGGRIERLDADGIVLVFGVPDLREDDALRAVRAAAELRDGLGVLAGEWGSAARVGVDTGKAVVGPRVASDAVRLAGAISRVAASGDVVLSVRTAKLVRDAIEAETVELAGKPHARLVSVKEREAGRRRRFDTPFVGRADELRALRKALRDARRESRCHALTVLGDAGIGKTRLVRELIDGLDAQILVGRCISYGEGATYLPVVELVRQAAGETSEEAIARLLEGEEGAELAARRLAELAGATDGIGSRGEAFWAIRLLLETLARRRATLVVLDDVHWAEPALLDLVEYLADRVEAPLLLLCIARQELLDERPGWAGATSPIGVLELAPLSEEESRELAAALAELDQQTRERVVELAEGNALHVEQLVAFVAEDGGDPSLETVPPSIEAVLAGRLGRLEPETRETLERAAVVGRLFERGALVALSPEGADVDEHLLALARKGLVRPRRSGLAGEDAYRFHHALVRDVAYAALTKAARADLHERCAAWLDRDGAGDDAIVGYHLEQASHYRRELGADADDLATTAGERLGTAGYRMWSSGDTLSTIGLLSRSTALLSSGSRRAELLYELSIALRNAGRSDEADAALEQAARVAKGAHDRRIHARAQVEIANARLLAGDGSPEELLSKATAAIEQLEGEGDDRGLGRAWLAVCAAHNFACRNVEMGKAAEQAELHYRRAGFSTAAAVGYVAASLYHGPTPVGDAVQRCVELRERASDRAGRANVVAALGGLRAISGRFDDAARLLEDARASFDELGMSRSLQTAWTHFAIELALAHGDFDAADALARKSCEALLSLEHEEAFAATRAVQRAAIATSLERLDEATEALAVARRAASGHDLLVQALVRSVDSRLLARRGNHRRAVAQGRAAVGLLAKSDALRDRASTLVALAEVYDLGGRRDEASAAAGEAERLFALKGDMGAAASVRPLATSAMQT